MVYVVLYICFLKVPVGAMPESFGEYCCLFGDKLWDNHIVVLLIHELGHLIRKPQKSICIILAPTVALVQQVSYYLSCWLVVKFETVFVGYMAGTLHNNEVMCSLAWLQL